LGVVGVVALNLFQNPLPNHHQILIHIRIQKPQNLDMQGVHTGSSSTIILNRLVSEVGVPVQLNGQPCGRTVKIKDVRANAVLPPEFVTAKIAPLQDTPELTFRWGGVVA
jgi:hypothetical protein